MDTLVEFGILPRIIFVKDVSHMDIVRLMYTYSLLIVRIFVLSYQTQQLCVKWVVQLQAILQFQTGYDKETFYPVKYLPCT